jgi:probable addiction module antidote protein
MILFINLSPTRSASILQNSYTRIRPESCIVEDTLQGIRAALMPAFKEKTDLQRRFRDNPKAVARHLNKSLRTNQLEPVLDALRQVFIGQNVAAVARESGLRRDKLYGSFGGTVDPTLSRVLALLNAMNVRLVAVPCSPRPIPPRPKLGRPRKASSRGPADQGSATNDS